MYEYHATVMANVDGDTLHTRVDLGIDVRVDLTLRLAGINAPEKSTPEGVAAQAYVAKAAPPGTLLVIRTAKDRREKYGRYLAWIQLPDKAWLNRALVTQNMAVPYGNLSVDPPSG